MVSTTEALLNGSFLSGKSIAAKNKFLFSAGINFNELPQWQKRGVGLYWEEYEKPGVNLKTGVTELPMKEEYAQFVRGLI